MQIEYIDHDTGYLKAGECSREDYEKLFGLPCNPVTAEEPVDDVGDVEETECVVEITWKPIEDDE